MRGPGGTLTILAVIVTVVGSIAPAAGLASGHGIGLDRQSDGAIPGDQRSVQLPAAEGTADTTGGQTGVVSSTSASGSTTSCTAITLSTSTVTTIETSGCYVITESVSGVTTTAALAIAASDVAIYGQNVTIAGDGTGDGVAINVYNSPLNVSIRNVTLTDWQTGIKYRAESEGGRIADVRVDTVATGLDLQGSGHDIVDLQGRAISSDGVTLAGNGNHELSNSFLAPGSTALGVSVSSSSNRVVGVNVSGGAAGIDVTGGTNDIESVNVSDVTGTGITLGSSGTEARNVSVTNVSTGFDLNGDSHVLQDTAIERLGSTAIRVGGTGSHRIQQVAIDGTSQGITVSGGTSNRIEGVRIENVEAHGIGLSGVSDTVIDSVLVQEVTGSFGQGIYVFGDSDNSIDDEDDNVVRNSRVDAVASGEGVYISSASNRVSNVTVTNSEDGVYVLDGDSNVLERLTLQGIEQLGVTLENSTGGTLNKSTVADTGLVGVYLFQGAGNVVADTTVTPSAGDGVAVNSSRSRVRNVAVTGSNEAVRLIRGSRNVLRDLALDGNDIAVSIDADDQVTNSNALVNVSATGSGAAFLTESLNPSLTRNNSVRGLTVEQGTTVSVHGAYNTTVREPAGVQPDFAGRESIGRYVAADQLPGPSYLNVSIDYNDTDLTNTEEQTVRMGRNETLAVGATDVNFFEVVTGENTADTGQNVVSANVTGLTGNLSDGPVLLSPTILTNDTDIFPEHAVGSGRATHTFATLYLDASGDGGTDRVYATFPDRLEEKLSVASASVIDLDESVLDGTPQTSIVDGPDGDGTADTIEVATSFTETIDAAVLLAVNVSYQSGDQNYTVRRYIQDSAESTTRGPDDWGRVVVQGAVSDSATPATATEGATSTHNVTVTYPSMTLDGQPDRLTLEFTNLSGSNLAVSEVRLAETRLGGILTGQFAWSEVASTDSHPDADLLAVFDLELPGVTTGFLDAEPQFEVQVTPNSTRNITVTRGIVDSADGPRQLQTVDTITVENGSGSGDDGSGAATAVPSIAISPADVSFGEVPVNQSVTETFEVTNRGTATLSVSNIEVVSGDEDAFTVGRSSLSLAPEESRNVSVTFAPEETISAQADIEIRSNDDGSPVETVEVAGFGIQSDLSLNRTAIDFGTVLTDNSARAAFTIRNDGSANLTLSGLRVGSENASAFAVGPTPDVLEPGELSVVNLTFTPATVGTANATLTVSTVNAGSVGVTLRGTGTGPELAVDTTALTFGEVSVGSEAIRNLTIRNGGSGTLTVDRLGTEGANATAFSANRTSLTIPSGAQRTVRVSFVPTASGPAEANLTIGTARAENGRVALRGVGAEANLTVSPVAVAFGSVSAGQQVTRNVTITNPGNAPLAIASATLRGRNASQYDIDAAAATGALGPGASREFAVTFQPTSDGSVSATLSLSTNDTSLPTYQIRLGGSVTAPNVRVSPGSLNFGEVRVTETATRNLTVSNTGNAPLEVAGAAFSSGLVRAASLRTATPLTIAPGASRELTVTFTPPAAQTYSGTLRLGTNDTDESTVPVWISNTNTTAQLDLRQVRERKEFRADVQNVQPGQEVDFNVSSELDVNQSGDTSWTGMSIEFADDAGADGSGGVGTLGIPDGSGAPGSALLSPLASTSARSGGTRAVVQQDRGFNFSINATSGPAPLSTTPEFVTPANGTLGLQFTNVSTSFSNDIVDDATMTFEVNKSRIAALNTTDPDDVQIYRYANGTWSAANTTMVRETATTYVYRAVAGGFSEWASGAQQAQFNVVQAEVSVSTVTVGDSVNVNVRIENTGGADGEFLTELLLDGEVVNSRRVDIAASGTAQVTFDRSFEQAGDYSVRVNDVQAGQVTVSSSDAGTSGSGAGGDSGGDAGAANGSGSGAESGTSGGAAGPAGGTGGNGGGSSAFGPGFGIPAAVLALLLGILLARRRQ